MEQDRRSLVRSRVLDALNHSGATFSTIRQVEEAMDRYDKTGSGSYSNYRVSSVQDRVQIGADGSKILDRDEPEHHAHFADDVGGGGGSGGGGGGGGTGDGEEEGGMAGNGIDPKPVTVLLYAVAVRSSVLTSRLVANAGEGQPQEGGVGEQGEPQGKGALCELERVP
eukprot:405439-Rhodomonas_salina.1